MSGNENNREIDPVSEDARPVAVPETPAATVGEALARARAAAGLDIAEVAERTKVRPSILRHIEADEHDELPALTYTLGFVKAFARTVGLDANETGERYRRESHKGDPVPTIVDMTPLDEQRRPPRALIWWTTALLILVLLLFWLWGSGWFTSPPPEPVETAEIAAAPIIPEADSEETVPVAPAPQPANAPVSLTATNEVWLQVTDSTTNERFFRGTLQPGQVLSLPPGRPWILRTGRVGALEVKIGSEVLPPLGAAAEYVGSLSLRPEDLLSRSGAAAGGVPVSR